MTSAVGLEARTQTRYYADAGSAFMRFWGYGLDNQNIELQNFAARSAELGPPGLQSLGGKFNGQKKEIIRARADRDRLRV